MMLNGRSGADGAMVDPHVVQIQISRYSRSLPAADEALEFLVAIHIEGTPTMWQRNTVLAREDEQGMLEQIDGLRLWSAGLGMTRRTAQAAVHAIGRMLRDVFLGRQGREVLAAAAPTAVLLMVDETVIHLPWEMMLDGAGAPLVLTPFGRVVTTRGVRPPGRDLSTEDPTVRILAVENPTEDLAATERVLAVIDSLRDRSTDLTVEVITLERKDATRRNVAAALAANEIDIVHFAGHGRFDAEQPEDSAVVLADGLLTDDHVLKLRWTRPPFIVINSSCESARAAAGRRIVTTGRRSNGLAAAFLGRGVEAYLGHYFLVDDLAAATFSEAFYATLLERRNVGTAVQTARERALARFGSDADLTALGAVFFGDAGTAERRDLATAS